MILGRRKFLGIGLSFVALGTVSGILRLSSFGSSDPIVLVEIQGKGTFSSVVPWDFVLIDYSRLEGIKVLVDGRTVSSGDLVRKGSLLSVSTTGESSITLQGRKV